MGGGHVLQRQCREQGKADHHAQRDVLMLLAVLVCGLGYAEVAKLSRSLGGWQVIC